MFELKKTLARDRLRVRKPRLRVRIENPQSKSSIQNISKACLFFNFYSSFARTESAKTIEANGRYVKNFAQIRSIWRSFVFNSKSNADRIAAIADRWDRD